MAHDPDHQERCDRPSEATQALLDELLEGIDVGSGSTKDELVRTIDAELSCQPCMARMVLLGDLRSHVLTLGNKELIFRNIRRLLNRY